MEILIADDDAISRRLVQSHLARWGHKVQLAEDGDQAFEALSAEKGPLLAVLDWMMPGMSGLEICRRVRATQCTTQPYIVLLTARNAKQDIVEGLEAGADDYIVKPFDREELRVRLQVGVRVVELQGKLAGRVRELQEALRQVKQLQGLLPICCYCKKIRGDDNYWQQIERYISNHSEAQFTHGVCPECYQKVVRTQLSNLIAEEHAEAGQNSKDDVGSGASG